MFFSFLLCASSAVSQCSTMIFPAPGMTKIMANTTIASSDGEAFWVCGGVTVTVTSSDGCLFAMEENATLIINGSDDDAVLAKAGCSVINNSDATILVSCNPATVTLTNTSSGSIETLSCAMITFDYSLVGGQPCSSSSGLEDVSNQALETLIFPNPTDGDFTLIHNHAPGKSLQIFNSMGSRVAAMSIKPSGSRYDIKDLSPCIYSIVVEGHAEVKRIVVR